MRISSLLKASVAAGLLVPAVALASGASNTARVGTTQAKPEARVCREVAITGSRIRPEKVCLTEKQWKEVDRQGG